jgi:N-methylhydantoinase A/oxoprolinase/acetone carboxylase beta subunit
MGGTSTDVCLVQGGVPEPAAGRIAAGFPIRLPSLDIHTIGAGGGSIATIDPGGALVVGPASAGAEPGPACYGRGGAAPTVTDADFLLGRIPLDAVFPGLGGLDRVAAAKALDAAGVSAEGVVAVVDANMERAVRHVTVARGVDPAGLALVAFGGAGPLHACVVAEALDMAAVVVPPRAGVLSAVGLLCAPRQRDLVRSWPTPRTHAGVRTALEALSREARAALAADGGDAEVTTSVDCRYAGQSHELTVASVDDFEAEHRRRNGYARPGAPIEVVAIRARARAAAPLVPADLGPPSGAARRPTRGPAVLAEADCTVWVPDGWSAGVGTDGSWVISR